MKPLTADPLPINADVIRVIEDILESAKRGEVSDVAIAFVKPGGISGNNYSHGANKAASLIGALQYLQRDIMNESEGVHS